MDLTPDQEEALWAMLYKSRPLKAARMLAGPENLATISEHLVPPEEVMLSEPPKPQLKDLPLEDIIRTLSEASQALEYPGTEKLSQGFGTVPVASKPQGTEHPDSGDDFNPPTGMYTPQKGPAPVVAPATQKKASYSPEDLAAMGYAVDPSDGSSRTTKVSPTNLVGLTGAAAGLYGLHNLRSSTQAKKRLASPISQYLEAVESNTLTPAKLKLINKELSILEAPKMLRAAENLPIAAAQASALRRAMASSITSRRIKSTLPIAALAALSALAYNTLSPTREYPHAY